MVQALHEAGEGDLREAYPNLRSRSVPDPLISS